MQIDNTLFNDLLLKATTSPRLRINFDLRDSANDKSQRMLNALLPRTILPIHRHPTTIETVILLRGCIDEIFYDDACCETARYHLDPLAGNFGLQVPAGQWHSLVAHEPSVLIEVKDGPWEPLNSTDILKDMDQDILKQQIKEFIEQEARSCSMDFGAIMPEYVHRMWSGRVPQEDIVEAMKDLSF